MLLTDGTFLSFTECSFGFHFGKAWVGVTENYMNGKGAGERDCWRCRKCRSDHRAPTKDVSLTAFDSFTELRSKIETLLPLKAAISSLSLKVDQLLLLKTTVDVLEKSVQSFESSMDFYTKQSDDVIASAVAREVTIKALETDVYTLHSTVSK